MHLKFLTMIFEGGDLRTGRLGVNTGLHDVDIDIPRAQVTVARIPQH